MKGARPAVAGPTACPSGAFCSSFVGNGLDGVPPGGVRGDSWLPFRSWPEHACEFENYFDKKKCTPVKSAVFNLDYIQNLWNQQKYFCLRNMNK